MTLGIICAILLVVMIVILLPFRKVDKTKENIERTPKDRLYVENVDEIIRREKTIKIIKYIVCYGFLTLLAIYMIFPFYWMINTSLKTESEISLLKPTFFPKTIAWDNYKYVIDIRNQATPHDVGGKNFIQFMFYSLSKGVKVNLVRFNVWRLMYNTLIVGIFSTIGTVVTTVMAAFAFSRIKFPGRDFIFTLFLGTMMIPGEMMVITNYITVISKWQGSNTYWAMIVPFLISVYYIYLLRQNFKQIPDELYYAAKVDGTSDLKYLFKVMIPIATPTLITITILKLMGSWNAYVWPQMVAAGNPNMYLISNGLRGSFTDSEGRSSQGRQMAAAFVVLFPLLVAFICLRKYLMRGVSRSGIKG